MAAQIGEIAEMLEEYNVVYKREQGQPGTFEAHPDQQIHFYSENPQKRTFLPNAPPALGPYYQAWFQWGRFVTSFVCYRAVRGIAYADFKWTGRLGDKTDPRVDNVELTRVVWSTQLDDGGSPFVALRLVVGKGFPGAKEVWALAKRDGLRLPLTLTEKVRLKFPSPCP